MYGGCVCINVNKKLSINTLIDGPNQQLRLGIQLDRLDAALMAAVCELARACSDVPLLDCGDPWRGHWTSVTIW